VAISRRTRRPDDDEDEVGLAVLPPDDPEDGDDEEDDEPEVDVAEGVRHARSYARARSAPSVDDDGGDDQTIPDRVVLLRLPKPWERLKLWVWLDYPEDVATLLKPRDTDAGETVEDAGERMMEFFRTTVVKHGGWRDRDGLLPQPRSRAFWARISTPLSRAIFQEFMAVIRRNPTPAASKKPKRRT
jgi:hypothetical protein